MNVRYFFLAALVGAMGCGTDELALSQLETAEDGIRNMGPWSTPVNLGSPTNTTAFEGTPALSRKGTSLYFAAVRAGGFGDQDLYVSQRADEESPWGAAVNLGPAINTNTSENEPVLSRDGYSLYFVSGRPGGAGGFDIYVSHRQDNQDDLAWGAATLVPNVNSPRSELGVSILEHDECDGPQLFIASNRDVDIDIYVSTMQIDGTFGIPTRVAELSDATTPEASVHVRRDGREMIFQRRVVPGNIDFWSAERDSCFDPWDAPTQDDFVNINIAASESQGSTSFKAGHLIFASNRPGGVGGSDLWESTREKARR